MLAAPVVLAFMTCCLSGGNNPDEPLLVTVTVANHQQPNPGAQAEKDEPLLIAGVVGVRYQSRMGVVKHGPRFNERNPVFPGIRPLLGNVPFETKQRMLHIL